MKNLILLAILVATNAVAGEITTTQVADKTTGFNAIIVTVPKELNYGFAILDVPSKSDGNDIRTYWNPSKHVVMINGGYFNPDFTPTGLCRINNKTISRIGSKKLSGFVALDKTGAVSILSHSDDLTGYPAVLQAGPYVIDPGGEIGIISRSGTRARRTLIGVTKDQSIVIIVTEPISLFDLAHSIKKHIPSIERLLNLDGGPSTALMTGSHTVVNMWPVRNYIFKIKETPTTD